MEFFVLMDSAFFGRGVFGVFSRADLARSQSEKISDTFCQWEVKKLELFGEKLENGLVYVAYLYHELYDSYTLDGIYANEEDAKEAAGKKGVVVEFRVDFPDHKRFIYHR